MINLKTILAGAAGTFQPGKQSFDAETERQLVAGGYAEYIEVAVIAAPEAAVIAPVEAAVVAPVETRKILGKSKK